MQATLAGATRRGEGRGVAEPARRRLAVQRPRPVRQGPGRRRAAREYDDIGNLGWALPELIEAAARTGNTHIAHDAIARLAETTQAGGTDFGLGLEARSRALVSEGELAETRYREAIERLGRTRVRPELARAHLLYGEWLRGENRHGTPAASCGPPMTCSP